jgi:hypothetical protein
MTQKRRTFSPRCKERPVPIDRTKACGKARSLWDLASLAFLTFLLMSVLAGQSTGVRAFQSSPMVVDSPPPTPHSHPTVPVQPTAQSRPPAERPLDGQSEPTADVSRVGGLSWQRPVGIGVILLGVILVIGGGTYLLRGKEN